MIRRPWAILALFTGCNLLNYLDRLVVSAVLAPMQAELGLSNLEGGLLATVFLFGYFLTAPLFGILGDRLPRKGLIAIGVVIWSLATIGSGLVSTFPHLLLVRAMVGVGEASYATLAPTIIDDLYPPEKKGSALAAFYIAMPIGGALGFIVGGIVGTHWGWRSAFFVAGGPGLVLALACLLIAEPVRTAAAEKANALRDLGRLVKMDLYRKGVFGYCALTAAIGAFSYWAPKFISVRHGLSLLHANTIFGGVTVVGGAIGTILGGRWADRSVRASAETAKVEAEKLYREAGYRDETPEQHHAREVLAQRVRVRALLKVCAMGSALGAPFAMAAFWSPTPTLFFVFVFFAIVFLFLNTSPINAVVLQAVPGELRASAMALSIFAIHILGDLWSPPFVGFLADHLPMALAMTALPLAIGLSAWLWWPRGSAVVKSLH